MEDILRLENVCKHYPKFDLDNVSLTLPSGCIMGFIGENGAGKSTTIKLILDVVHKDSGQIFIFGKENTCLDTEMKEYIGTVMDALHLPEEMTAMNVGVVMRKVYKTWQGDRFKDYLKKFRIDTKKYIREYSRGMKMKLSMAIALSHDTKLLILDEATSGLDPVVREEILDMLLEFIQDENHGVFISSHILSDLEKVCDYITFIHNGKIILSDDKDAMMDKYAILKCTAAQLDALDKKLGQTVIIARQGNRFGASALVDREKVQQYIDSESARSTSGGQDLGDMILDAASLEDIMVFYVKEA